MRDAVVVQNLGKRFRRFHADRPWTFHEALLRGFRKLRPSECFWGLRDVSFRIAPGRMVGVIGRNGAGKSTLLRLIGGVGLPDEGSVKVQGRIGALLNLGAGFHPDLTGRENLFINGVIGGLTRREVVSQIDSIIAFSELEDYIDSPLRVYSTGMQMRPAFSIAIHAQPDILLIDEVLAVGDLSFQRKCIDRISQLKSKGCAIVLVSHETALVQELCEEALWLCAGKLAAHGPAEIVVGKYIAETDAEAERILASESSAGSSLEENLSELLELEITGVRLLDPLGSSTAEIDSGDPLSIEISYISRRRVDTLNFQVYINREDGMVCCEMGTQTSASTLSGVYGEGRILLHIEQLNLIGGVYHLAVGAYKYDWSSGYDYREKVKSFRVSPTGTRLGILLPPHRWEVKYLQDSETEPAPVELPSTPG